MRHKHKKTRSRNKWVSDGKVKNNGWKKINIKISHGLKNTACDWIFIMSGVKVSSATYFSRCLPRILTFCWLLLCVTLTKYACGAISCYLGDWNSSTHINEQINSALHSKVQVTEKQSSAEWGWTEMTSSDWWGQVHKKGAPNYVRQFSRHKYLRECE